MGIDRDFGAAFAKSQIAAGNALPLEGNVFISVKNKDKRRIIFLAKKIADMGFHLIATAGTRKVLEKNGLDVQAVFKVSEGRPDVVDFIKNGQIQLIINTPSGKKPKADEVAIRTEAVVHGIPCITTIYAAYAAVNGIESMKKREFVIRSIQEYHEEMVVKTED